MAFLQGIYEVKNKNKYLGPKNPRYMSSYELQTFQFLDYHPEILKWGSEIIIIDYFSPVDLGPGGKMGKMRRYMVDLYVEYIKNGELSKELIEIKPLKDLKIPKKTGRKKKETYLREVYTYNVNKAKWAAAKKYAEARGWKFKFLTENQIFG